MGTVKYTGPVASFHCPTNAEIRSLKVHFSPKQEGSGDPSPENVRLISGWTGCNIIKRGKNLLNLSNDNIIYENYSRATDGSYFQISGKTITLYNAAAKSYMVCFSATTITASMVGTTYILNATETGNGDYGIFISDLDGSNRTSNKRNPYTITANDVGRLIGIRVRINGLTGTYTVTDIQFELGSTATPYEPYQGSITNYEFGVLGKNKLPIGTTTFTRYKPYNLENPLQPGIYTVSALITSTDTDKTTSSIMFEKGRLEDKNLYVQLDRDIENSKTFTLQQECSKVYLYAASEYDSSANDVCTWSNVQLELGSTATTYEPYNPNHTVYGGWVDLISGEVVEEWACINIPFDKTWDYSSSSYYLQDTNLPTINCAITDFIISHHKNTEIAADTSIYISSSKYWVFGTAVAQNLNLNSSEEINVWLKEQADNGTPVQICGTLAPSAQIHYSLTPTQLQTFLGQNNVWSNADYVEVEYDLHETQDILARKQFIVANQPHIVKPAAAPLQNFTTDVPAPLKECKVHFEPVQDLHGYDKPWPAGGGKNIAKPYDNNYVSSTYVSFDYSAANGTFRCYGTASASSTHSSPSATNAANNGATFTLPAGTYTLSIIDGDGANIYAQCVSSDETVLAETTSYTTFTTNEALTVFVRLKVAAGATVDNTVKIQLEAGSTATSYVPYENVCPISGRSGLTVTKCGKNLFDPETMITNESYYIKEDGSLVANNLWRLTEYIPITGRTVTLSHVGGNAPSIALYDKDKNFIGAKKYDTGDGTIYGNVTITVNSDASFCRFSVYSNQVGWLNGTQLELGSTATDYEPYNGTTIPITFPSITNLLNSVTITANKTLSSAGEETSESGMSLTNYIKVNEGDTYKLTFTSKEGARTRRIYGYDVNKDPVESLASVSWVTVDTTGTVQATIPSGVEYIRVCYKTADENIFLEGPESSVIYGGYVDLISGTLAQEWAILKIADLQWEKWSGSLAYYSGMAREAGTVILSDTARIDGNGNPQLKGEGTIGYYGTNTTYPHYLFMKTGSETQTAASLRTWIKETYPDAKIAYCLKTPITYQLTPTQLKTLRGTNNIWANANDNIEIAYWKH